MIILLLNTNERHLDSSPVELPTSFNVSYFAPQTTPQLNPKRGSHPISPVTPDADSQWNFPTAHGRRPSSLSLAASSSIDDVMTGRTSHFREAFDNEEDTYRARHGSQNSQASDNSHEPAQRRGNQTIPEGG